VGAPISQTADAARVVPPEDELFAHAGSADGALSDLA
jgi:hypothetical protein